MTGMMDEVDRLTRRRARVATIMGILFICLQAFRMADSHLERPVDYVQFGGWVAWTVVLLLFLLFGGVLWRRGTVRAMLNDEGTEANRRGGLVAGFWAALAAAALCYILTFFDDVPARDAIHVIVTVGVGAAMLRFGALERRALKE